MKRCILDGATLADGATLYRKLAETFDAPPYFGNNPDALWDAITEYSGEPLEIVWRHAAVSAQNLGGRFAEIITVLETAAAEGRLKLRLE